MQTVAASFVIVNANTPDMKVFFNGEEVIGVQDLNQTSVLNWINANTLTYIETPLKELQLIPAESTVVDAKLLDDSYFMVKLG